MSPVTQVVLINSLIIFALLIIALVKKEQSEGLKLFLFTGIAAATAIATFYLSIDTVVRNQNSQTSGPVHWHADFEIFACGQKVDLLDPTGISNRIGKPDLHEHGDDRIHVEGTIAELQDVSLGKFFEVIGGQLTNTLLRAPTNQGELILQNGSVCPDGKPATLQVFVYQTKNKTITQKKLTDLPSYVMSPESQIPPGDCVIFEFASDIKEKTSEMCNFYHIGINKGEYHYSK